MYPDDLHGCSNSRFKNALVVIVMMYMICLPQLYIEQSVFEYCDQIVSKFFGLSERGGVARMKHVERAIHVHLQVRCNELLHRSAILHLRS